MGTRLVSIAALLLLAHTGRLIAEEPKRDSAAMLEVYAEIYELKEAQQTLAKILADAREKVVLPEYDSLLNAQKTLEAIHRVVHRRTLLQEDCVDRALRYLAVAEELGIELRIFAAGDHVFVSLKGSYYDLGWEPEHGKWRNHRDYQQEYRISDAEVKNGVFLVPLDRSALKSVAYTEVASQHDKKGDREKACAAIKRAIELNPKNALAFCLRAGMHQEAGDVDHAIADYAKAIELFAAYDTALWELAMLKNQREQYRESRVLLDQLSAIYPLNDSVRETRDFIFDKEVLDPVFEWYRKEEPRGERAVYAFPSTAKIVDVSRSEHSASVLPDWNKIRELPLDERQVFLIHNHAMPRELYLDLVPLSAAEQTLVRELDQETFDRRTMIEVPSPPLRFGDGGDIRMLLMAEQHFLEDAPKVRARHFLLCFRESGVPQAVEYGLSPQARYRYRRLLDLQQRSIAALKLARENEPEGSERLAARLKECRDAIAEAEQFERKVLKAYLDAWQSYASQVRLPRSTSEELAEREEPSLDQFAAHLEKSTEALLFVKNYGAFPRHGKGLWR